MANALKRLTAAALALPALAPRGDAAEPIIEPEFDLISAHYQESDGRMQINSHKGRVLLPAGRDGDLTINASREILSGASPELVFPGAEGPEQVLSAATIVEKRSQLDLSYRHFFGDWTMSLHGGRSLEDDYQASFFNLGASRDFANKSFTVDGSIGFSDDRIDATARETGGDKDTLNARIGITQIIDKQSLIQANLTFNEHSGYLDDPYKLVLVADLGVIGDSRPDRREQWAVLVRYVRHMPWDAALHLDGRYYTDSWSVDAQTVEASWHQPLPKGWMLIPRLRYYSQDHAEFHAPVFDSSRPDDHYSNDYRLDAFGALSGSIRARKELGEELSFSLTLERYERRADWNAFDGDGFAGADYHYSLVAASMEWRF